MVSNMEMEQTKQMVGQHFVAGFAGLKLSEEFVRLIKEYKFGAAAQGNVQRLYLRNCVI